MQIITAPRIKTAGKRATAAPYLNENKSRQTNSSTELNFKTCQTKSYPRSTLQCMHTCQSLSPEIQEVAPETFCRSSSTLLGELVGLGWVGLGWVGFGFGFGFEFARRAQFRSVLPRGRPAQAFGAA